MTSPSRRPLPRRDPAEPPPKSGPSARSVSKATARALSAAVAEAKAGSASRAASRAEPEPSSKRRLGRRAESKNEPRLDGSSWASAIIAMVCVGALLWIVQIANAFDDYGFNRAGLRPREVGGLWGIVAQPFLHASYRDMISDTLPVVLIGWVLLLAGARTWAIVTAVVVLVGGFLTWLAGPGHTFIVGDSSLVFGWIGYLVARAIISRKIKWILVAIMVLLIFGTLLAGLVPVSHSQTSWQAHLSGFVAGVGIAALLHPRRGRRRPAGRPAVT